MACCVLLQTSLLGIYVHFVRGLAGLCWRILVFSASFSTLSFSPKVNEMTEKHSNLLIRTNLPCRLLFPISALSSQGRNTAPLGVLSISNGPRKFSRLSPVARGSPLLLRDPLLPPAVHPALVTALNTAPRCRGECQPGGWEQRKKADSGFDSFT